MADAERRRLERARHATDSAAAELDLLRARRRQGDPVVEVIPDDWVLLDASARPGGVSLIYADADYRLWGAAHVPDHPTLAAPLGVAIPDYPRPDAAPEGFRVGDRLVAIRPDGFSVHAWPSGELLHERFSHRRFPFDPTELTLLPLPGDLGVAVVKENAIWTLPLEAPFEPRRVALPSPPEWDNPEDGAAASVDERQVAILIACYGYCDLLRCRRDGPGLVVDRRQHIAALVHDPVFVSHGAGTRHLLLHGYGTALSMVDLTDGRQIECPLPPGASRDYGLYGGGLVTPDGARAVITTRGDAYLWRFPSSLEPLPSLFARPVYLDDRAGLVNDGGRLRTVPLP